MLVETGWIKGYTLNSVDEVNGTVDVSVELLEPIKYITISADIFADQQAAS